MLMMSQVLVEESNPLHIRNAAGLALKNALSARVSLSHKGFITRKTSHEIYSRKLQDKQS